LLAWVLSWWEGNQLALAVDATTLGQRFVVLVVSVLYRGCAIPVAWSVLPATEKQAWRGEWLRMLRQGRAVVPRRYFVIGMAGGGGGGGGSGCGCSARCGPSCRAATL